METIRFAIDLQDRDLAAALARAIAADYPYIHAALGENPGDADFTITDDFLGSPAPVREIVSRALAACGKTLDWKENAGSCPFTAFTSACGGRGVSSCSLLYAKAVASEGKTVLLISFDPYVLENDTQAGMALLHALKSGAKLPLKAACIQSEHGFHVPAQSLIRNALHECSWQELQQFFANIEDSAEWDEVVLDVPRAFGAWREVMRSCERQVIVSTDAGRCDALAKKEDALYKELSAMEADGQPAALARFCPQWDDAFSAADADLYGQLGSEVRTLARSLWNG